jgi:hypothetical protein
LRWAGPSLSAGLTGTASPLRELLIIRTLSAGAACDLAATLLGSAVDYAIQVPAAAGNQVFRIGRGDLVAFLKLADDCDLKRELAVLQLLGPLGVPVPVIEAADPAGDLAGAPCALLRQVDGGPLSGAAPEFGAVGPILRQVHEVILDGSGSIACSSEGLRGEDHTWAGAVRHRIAGLGPIAEAGLVAAGLLDRAVAAVEDRRDSYGDAAWLPADLTGTLLVYAVVFTIWSMQGEFSGGAPWPPWWPAQATALSVIVDELDRR